MITKICTVCKVEKPLDEFSLSAHNKRDGRKSWCKECCSKKARVHEQKPEVKARTSARQRVRSERPEVKTKKQNEKLKRNYGLDVGVLAVMVLARDGKCDISGEETDLVVDHIHGTQIVRGLISRKRNSGIDLLGDNLEGVLEAADYLVASQFDVFAGIKRQQLKAA